MTQRKANLTPSAPAQTDSLYGMVFGDPCIVAGCTAGDYGHDGPHGVDGIHFGSRAEKIDREARSRGPEWVPTSSPPTGRDRYVLTAIRGGIVDRWYWTERDGFTGMGGPVIAWQEMPEFPAPKGER